MDAELRGLADRVEALLTEWGDAEMREERDAIATELRSLSVAQGQGFVMVPRVASMGIRGVLYRTRSGYGDDYMTPEQADALWVDLLAAAPAQPDGVE